MHPVSRSPARARNGLAMPPGGDRDEHSPVFPGGGIARARLARSQSHQPYAMEESSNAFFFQHTMGSHARQTSVPHEPESPARSPARSDHDQRKERERTELVQMILESIANVPVAVERIHTNEKLRLALHQEIGGTDLLQRFFDQGVRGSDGTFQGSPTRMAAWGSASPRSSTGGGEDHDSMYHDAVDGGEDEEGDEREDEEDDDDSAFGYGYEEDLALAVNQLVMSGNSLHAMEKKISEPIVIANNGDAGDVGSNRTSSSPHSSICFGASPGTCSQDGEPVSALWPRQPHQFAFTQEEEGTTRGEDEVYSEIISSMCEDESLHDDDDEHGDDFDEMQKVFEMEDEDGELAGYRSDGRGYGRDGQVDEDGHYVRHSSNNALIDGEDDDQEDEDEMEEYDEREGAEYDVVHLRIVREKNRTGFEPSKDLLPRVGSVIAGRYKVELAIGEAVFSRTYKCIDLTTNKLVCLKVIKNNKEYFDQGVDEIRVLEYLNRHCDVDEKHLVRMLDYFYFREHLIIVTELLRDNLYEFSKLLLQRGVINYFNMPRLKKVAIEVLEALNMLHSIGLVHCDLKPENILISNFSECNVKVIDFGSACFVTDELTSYVQSRSYRAPEVILGLNYDSKIDLWSLGCVMAELFTGEVLFKNDSEQSLLARIIATIGPIPAEMFDESPDLLDQFRESPHFALDSAGNGVLSSALPQPPLNQVVQTADNSFLDFLRTLLQINPSRRASAADALTHPWLATGVFSSSPPL